MAQILLTTLNAKYIHMNLAIRILYGQNRSYEGLHWKEFALKEKAEEIANQCLGFEVVCFSCYIWNISQTLVVATILKEMDPHIKILLGGPEVSYDHEDLIRNPVVDYIIPGEGEIPFREFLNHYPQIQNVQGLVYKEQGEVKYNPCLESFDLKAFEDFNPYLFEPTDQIASKIAYIETSRGCPYKCEFCLASLDNKVRYLPMKSIKENLLFLMEHGKVIKFLDRTFNVKKDFTLDIFRFILDNHKPGNVFQFEITADIVHPDIVKFIQEEVPKGLFRFEIGIQTVNRQANLEVNRKQDFEKTSAVIHQLKDKVEMHLDLIVGLPLDYYADIQYSFEKVFALHPPELQLGFLKFLKGTPVREKYEQYGFVFDPNPPYQIIKSNYLNEAELESITHLEEALELYWNKKRAVHTLLYAEKHKGIFPFLTNLGLWFSTRSDFHHHTLDESYDLLSAYCMSDSPGDQVLQELIAMDYYLHFKIKPKTRFVEEVGRDHKRSFINRINGNTQEHRFIVVPVHFDFILFQQTGEIQHGDFVLGFKYTGTAKALVCGQFPASLISG